MCEIEDIRDVAIVDFDVGSFEFLEVVVHQVFKCLASSVRLVLYEFFDEAHETIVLLPIQIQCCFPGYRIYLWELYFYDLSLHGIKIF
jgi:hypothetical protein